MSLLRNLEGLTLKTSTIYTSQWIRTPIRHKENVIEHTVYYIFPSYCLYFRVTYTKKVPLKIQIVKLIGKTFRIATENYLFFIFG